MAQRFYGIDRLSDDGSGVVTTSTSDTSKEIQIVVVTGGTITRKDVKTYAERLIRYIEAEDTASVLAG